MIGVLLGKAALKALTGYTQPSKQIAWFKRQLNIDPPVGRDGYPKVTQSVVDQATLAKGSPAAGQPAPATGSGPKWKVPA